MFLKISYTLHANPIYGPFFIPDLPGSKSCRNPRYCSENLLSVVLQELLTAQMIPTKKNLWEAGGHAAAPIRFDQISNVAMRRMSGNSFNQAVATTFVAYVLCHMQPQ